jgi:SAM-dependent methyltransferase
MERCLKIKRALLWVLDKSGALPYLERSPSISPYIFDLEYKSGAWDYLDSYRGDPYGRIILRYAPSARILDLGCGTARNIELQSGTYSRYVGVDFSPEAIRRARLNPRPNCEYLVANILDYEPEGPFDLVMLREVAYYLPADSWEKLMPRLTGCLAPGGVVVLQLWEKSLLLPALAQIQAAGLPILEEISSGEQTTVIVGPPVMQHS